MPLTGNGTTIAFATSSFTANVVSMDGNEQSVPDVNISHLTTTDYEEYMPGDLVELGEFSFDIQFDPNNTPPVPGSVTELVTVTYPPPTGDANGAENTFSAYVKSWKHGTVENNNLITGTITLKLSGATYTWSDSTG